MVIVPVLVFQVERDIRSDDEELPSADEKEQNNVHLKKKK